LPWSDNYTASGYGCVGNCRPELGTTNSKNTRAYNGVCWVAVGMQARDDNVIILKADCYGSLFRARQAQREKPIGFEHAAAVNPKAYVQSLPKWVQANGRF